MKEAELMDSGNSLSTDMLILGIEDWKFFDEKLENDHDY
jgi:hypothetical protein